MIDIAPSVRVLKEEDITRFWDDGVLVVRDFYSSKWIKKLIHALDDISGLVDNIGATAGKDSFTSNVYNWLSDDRIRDFALFSGTAQLVQQALKSKQINLFSDQTFVRPAGNRERTPWHHDLTFFPLSGNQIASVWTSVDQVSAEESSMHFIVGSHRWSERFRPLGVGGVVKSVAPLPPTPDFDAERSRYEVVSWDMQPGDAVLFHALTLHGTRGKLTGKQHRRAIATRWCGDDVTFSPTGIELQVPWKHGLMPGDGIGGPIFPRVCPSVIQAEIAPRMLEPIAMDEELRAQNSALAARFERVAV